MASLPVCVSSLQFSIIRFVTDSNDLEAKVTFMGQRVELGVFFLWQIFNLLQGLLQAYFQ
jgi:hypothetical protein